MIIESILYNKLDSKKVKCNVCNHRCLINENSYGFCNTRRNNQGKLYSCNFALISSFKIDPIEKKPLYHFLPGSKTYSLGGFGCNMTCLNCQNYTISQHSSENFPSNEILPEMAVENAHINKCQSIAFTYNEPTMYLEYTLETAKLSHKKGLKNVYVSNGYMSDEALNLLLPYIDAFNIDLKAMSNDFYKNSCKAKLDPALDNLKKIYKNNNHLEVTNLLIDSYNDSNELIESLTNFIANELGVDVPLHFSRFFPYYKTKEIPPTSLSSLNKAEIIAKESGLRHVYIGNTINSKNTHCPNCGELLIKRNEYDTIDNKKIENNHCINCNENLNFVT